MSDRDGVSSGGSNRRRRRKRGGSSRGGAGRADAGKTASGGGGSSGSGSSGSGGGGGGGARKAGGGRGRGPRRGSQAYKKKVEERLFGKRDAGRGRMIERLRQAQGTPNFTRIYREFVKGHGMPDDLPTLVLMLDIPDEREALKVIDAIYDIAVEAPSDQKSLLKSRLRNLEMSTSSDSLADSAADLLRRL